jgi:glycosyltransferase involved in cell wall biosynthesis
VPGAVPEAQSLLFFGALNYYPNESGLGWFLDQVWPLLRKSHPGVTLKVVGQHPPESLKRRRDPGVEIVGAVPDLRPWLSKATATLAPLHVGGGTRLKILEAMAMGRPVVSTRIGAEGIDIADGEQVLLGDTPEAFAAQVRRTLDDAELCRRMGTAARRLVEEKYGWDAAVGVIERFMS